MRKNWKFSIKKSKNEIFRKIPKLLTQHTNTHDGSVVKIAQLDITKIESNEITKLLEQKKIKITFEIHVKIRKKTRKL